MTGVHIRLDSPACLGDYRKLDRDDKGFVMEIGWGSTRIPALPNNIVAVLNTEQAGAMITKYAMRASLRWCHRAPVRRRREPDLALFLAMTGEGYSQRKRRGIWRTSRGPGVFSASYEVTR